MVSVDQILRNDLLTAIPTTFDFRINARAEDEKGARTLYFKEQTKTVKFRKRQRARS